MPRVTRSGGKSGKSSNMSSIVAGDKRENRLPSVVRSTVGNYGTYNNVQLGMPVSGLQPNLYSNSTAKGDLQKKPPMAEIDIRGYFGDERTGVRKTVPAPAKKAPAVVAPIKKAPAAVKRTPTVINIPGGGLRVGPAKSSAPTRMGVNRVTGNTTGFSSGKTTGSTVSKAGTAIRTNTSAFSRAQQNAFNKGGVAGPSRSSGGGSRSSSSSSGSRSTGGGTNRGDVGAGRRGGGR